MLSPHFMPPQGLVRACRALARILICAASLTFVVGHAQTVTLLTHDSFTLPEALVDAFEAEHEIDLRLLAGGDAGALVNRAILTAGRPLGDALFGIDDALFAREGASELFETYRANGIAAVPDELRFAGDVLTPITVGYVTLNYDVDALAARDLAPPADLADLAAPSYAQQLVVTDPATSSPGLAFLLTTIARFGEGGEGDWLDFWASLRDGGVRVVSGWSDAYYASFTRYGGDRPIALSYATSPAAEVLFSEVPLTVAPTTSLHCDRCAWRQIEAVGVLAGADEVAAAQLVVDFLLSREVQQAIPEAMFVYPVRNDVTLPEPFRVYGPAPQASAIATLEPGRIEANQARWLEQWTRVVRQGRAPSEVR